MSRYLTRAEGLVILLSLTDSEAKRLPERIAALSEERDDLGYGIRQALAEIAAAREGGGE